MGTPEPDEFDPRNWSGSTATWGTEVNHECSIGFSMTTTGLRGGDWGHGSRLLIEIEDLGGTAMEVRETVPKNGQSKLSILVGGDAELLAMAEGLEFLAKHIRTVVRSLSAPTDLDDRWSDSPD